jgi:hypothetical protein
MSQEALPDGRHAGRTGHLLRLEEIEQRLAIECPARKHELGADHRRHVRQPPGIDVEHRHHRQDAVSRRQVQRIRQRRRHRMQDGGPMAVEHALRVARGAGRVAHRRGGVLVELRPGKVVRRGSKQVLVAQQVHLARRRHLFLFDHRHPMADRLAQRCNAFDDWQEGEIEEQGPVFGIVDDPGDLLGDQARVQRVQHAAAARDTEVQLEVPIAVPGQRGDAFPRLDADTADRVRHLTGTSMQRAVGSAVNVALDPARHDLDVGVMAVGMLDQCADEQGRLHHLSMQHEGSPVLLSESHPHLGRMSSASLQVRRR